MVGVALELLKCTVELEMAGMTPIGKDSNHSKVHCWRFFGIGLKMVWLIIL